MVSLSDWFSFTENMSSCLVDEAGGMSVMMITERNIPLLSSCCRVCQGFVQLSSMRIIALNYICMVMHTYKQEHQRIFFDSKSFSTISLFLAQQILAPLKCRHIPKLWNRIALYISFKKSKLCFFVGWLTSKLSVSLFHYFFLQVFIWNPFLCGCFT